MPRRTTAHLFHSLDGVVESPQLWQFDRFGAHEGEMMTRAVAGVTDVVIGRALWQEWSQSWPGATDPFGAFINPVRKHVVTGTLRGDLGWNSTAIDGDPVRYVRSLRDGGDGGDGGIIVVGGIDTVRSLFLAGVIDALTLTIHPVVAGTGRRLFDESTPTTRLQLLEGTVTELGNAVLTYALRGS